MNMSKTQALSFEWSRATEANPGLRLIGGSISISEDAHGLPVLLVSVDDDYYSGVLDHRTLMRLITVLALHGLKTG